MWYDIPKGACAMREKNKTDFLFGRSEKSGSFKPLHYQFGNRGTYYFGEYQG